MYKYSHNKSFEEILNMFDMINFYVHFEVIICGWFLLFMAGSKGKLTRIPSSKLALSHLKNSPEWILIQLLNIYLFVVVVVVVVLFFFFAGVGVQVDYRTPSMIQVLCLK